MKKDKEKDNRYFYKSILKEGNLNLDLNETLTKNSVKPDKIVYNKSHFSSLLPFHNLFHISGRFSTEHNSRTVRLSLMLGMRNIGL